MWWLATPLSLVYLYRILWEQVYHCLPVTPIVQYSKVQAATHSATPHGIFLYQHLYTTYAYIAWPFGQLEQVRKFEIQHEGNKILKLRMFE